MRDNIPAQMAAVLKALEGNHFGAHYAASVPDAKELVLKMISASARVGVGDSATLRQLGVLEELERRGNEVIDAFRPELTGGMGKDPERHRRLMWQTFGTDVFITGANAVTGDGKIVSIDRSGNRVAGMIFAAPEIIVVLGRNKIVGNAGAAVARIKNVIAPEHARRKQRNTPCAATGICTDCDSPDRLCCATVILEKKTLFSRLSVVLVDQDLGLGWDPAWDKARIERIRENYYQHTWLFTAPKLF
jgi:hypothetical protein